MKNKVVIVTLLCLFCISTCAVQAQRLAIGEISVSVTVPTTGWRAEIQDVRRVEDELWVLCKLIPPMGMTGQAISTVSDKISLRAPALPVRHFVIGASPTWPTPEEHTFITSTNELGEKWRSGTVYFKKDTAEDKEKYSPEIALSSKQLNALHPGDTGIIRLPQEVTVTKVSADSDIVKVQHSPEVVMVLAQIPGKTQVTVETVRNEVAVKQQFEVVVCETEWRADIKRLAETPARLIGMMVFVQGTVHSSPETVGFQVFGKKMGDNDWILANSDTQSAVWVSGLAKPEADKDIDLAALVIEAGDGWSLRGVQIVKHASYDKINRVASGQYIALETICGRNEICNFILTGRSIEILNHYPRFVVYLRAAKPGKAVLSVYEQSVMQQTYELNEPQTDIPSDLFDRLRGQNAKKVEFEVFMFAEEIPDEN